MEDIRCINEEELRRLGARAMIIDVREPGEFACERLPGSLNVPLSGLEAGAATLSRDKAVVLLCRSGQRSREAARRLDALGFREILVLEGGLQKCGGLEKGPGGAWAMERQVRMAAGLLVTTGAILGWLVHPWFWALSAGVGLGLVYSAATDTCGMAMVLARMPWNRR
jgi:rhodanese-related sulfurtransferase